MCTQNGQNKILDYMYCTEVKERPCEHHKNSHKFILKAEQIAILHELLSSLPIK